MDNYDIDTIISLFRERGNTALFLTNESEPDNLHSILDRFPIFEKYNCFSFSINLKQGKSIKQLLKDNQYTEKFCVDDLIEVLKNEITTTSAFIIFFNIFSFIYYSDNNDSKNPDSNSTQRFENELTIDIFTLFIRCLSNLNNLQIKKHRNTNTKSEDPLESQSPEASLSPEFYDRLIFFFFKNIFPRSLHFFDDNEKQIDTSKLNDSILLVLSFFYNQRRLPIDFFEMFITFIFKEKVHEHSEDVLELLQKMFKEKRPFVVQNDISKIIEYVNPFLVTFNQCALDLIVTISTTFKTLTKSFIDCFSNISLSLINVLIESPPRIIIKAEEVDFPYNIEDRKLNQKNSGVDFIKELTLNFVETKSCFEKGFVCPTLSENGINWLLGKMDTNVIEIVNKLVFSFMTSAENVLDHFFTTFKYAIQKINKDYFYDLLAIFYHFANAFQKNIVMSKFFDFILDEQIFNEKETIFTSLDEIKSAFRNGAFTILSDYPETIGTFIINSLNPLFRTELLFRIKNYTHYYSIIDDVVSVCCSLQNYDIKWHCESIENARCCAFCFLANLFLGMFNSYNYFEEVMQFCMEKNISHIFINLYKETTFTSKNFELLHKVFGFITKLFSISLELSWKFIEITDSIFDQRNYLIPQMKVFFILIMNYIMKLKSEPTSEVENIEERSFKAVQMSLKYICLFKSINPHHLHLITSILSKNMSNDLFLSILQQMGKSPRFNNKIDCFVIKFPIFIPIFLFSNGFTRQVMRIFTNLCNFSIRNICFFHDQHVDSILIQILQNKKTIKYRNERFDDFYYDRSILSETIKELLFTICSHKTDLRVVSQLMRHRKFIPFIHSLLDHFENSFYPIISIPTTTAETQYSLNYSNFANDFSFSFWINFDVNYLNSFPTENIEIITVHNGVRRFGFYLQGTKLRAYYSNGKTRSDVNLNFFKSNKCEWTLISSCYIRESKSFETFCYEMPMNKSDFDGITFNEEDPIIIRINSKYSKRVYNPKNNNYNNFYSFVENEFIGFIKDIKFYNKRLTSDDIFDLLYRPMNNNVTPKVSLSEQNDFIIKYQHIDNIFNVLRRETIITQFVKLLLKPNQEEEICYDILYIIGKLADVIKIPFASLMLFIGDSNHFKFKGTFNYFYFIFENIKSNQSKRIKFFNIFISNALLWCHFDNFKDILFFYQTKLVIQNSDLLVDHSGLNMFLYYFDLIDASFWNDYSIFLKRLFEKSTIVESKESKEDIIVILCYICRKFNQIKSESKKFINEKPNLSSIILNQLKIETSNITAFYPSICQTDTENNKKDDNNIFKLKKVPEIHENKDAASSTRKEKKKSKELRKFDEAPKEKKLEIKLLEDIPDEFKEQSISTEQNENNQENEENIKVEDNNTDTNESNVNISEKDRMYIIFLLQLIEFKSHLFAKNDETFPILLHLLQLKDLKITERVLITLYNFSLEQSISGFTLIAYNNLNKEFFKPIFEFLKSKIQKMPNFFPLLCALAVSMNPKPDCFDILSNFGILERIPTSANETNEKDTVVFNNYSNENQNNFDPWYFFPIMLGFSLPDDSLIFLFQILLQNSGKEWKSIEKMAVLFDFMSNYFENHIILVKFLEYVYEFNNDFIYDITRYSAMVLFTHPYLSNISTINLLTLINDETLISKFVAFEVGIRLYQRGQMDKSFEILLRLIDSIPAKDGYNQLILTLNSIFRSEIQSSNSFYEMSLSCDQLIKDYKSIFGSNFKEIFASLRNTLITDMNKRAQIRNSNLARKKTVNDNLEIINNQVEHSCLSNGKRLSSQFDCMFRQMIYRSDEKLPKNIEIPDINCFLFNNESINNIGINYEQNGNKVKIITPTSQRCFDLSQDVNFIFKRPNNDAFEIFTKFGKKYRFQFLAKNQKKDIAPTNYSKLFDETVTKWSRSEMTNFEFLMFLNAFADNVHQEKAIFPSPLYKRKAVPDGKWSSLPLNKDDKKETLIKTKRFSLLNHRRFNSQNAKKRGSTLSGNRKRNATTTNISAKKAKTNSNDNDDFENSSLNENENDTFNGSTSCSNESILNNEGNDSNRSSEIEIDYRNVDHDIINFCFENQIVPARYFYDFELYNEECECESENENRNKNGNENKTDNDSKNNSSNNNDNSNTSNDENKIDNDNSNNNNDDNSNLNDDENKINNDNKNSNSNNNDNSNTNDDENKTNNENKNGNSNTNDDENKTANDNKNDNSNKNDNENANKNVDVNDEKAAIKHKIEFELMYNMRKCIENYSSIDIFAESFLGLKINAQRKLIERKNRPGLFQSGNKENLIFAVALKSFSQSSCSSFLAINADYVVRYVNCIEKCEIKATPSFLSSLTTVDANTQKQTHIDESSLTSYIINNYNYSAQSPPINAFDSLVLDNVNIKSRLFQLDDGIATFDPNKKILVIFTTSSIEKISASPSPLLLTSLTPLDSLQDMNEVTLNSPALSPFILSTSIPEVHCKTYTMTLSDSIELLCGNSERQFYTVSPTVVYSNNRFFAQFNSAVKILKVSMIFNVIAIATEDAKVHICSSTSGKKISTIDMNKENSKLFDNDDDDDSKFPEISEILITHNFGFILVVMKNGNLLLYTINGTLIKSTQIEARYRNGNIRLWFTFDTVQGIDYIGFVTSDEKIFYFEAFYPSTLVQMTSNEKFKNILAVNYDKFTRCFLILNSNYEISVVTHNVLVVPINYDLTMI